MQPIKKKIELKQLLALECNRVYSDFYFCNSLCSPPFQNNSLVLVIAFMNSFVIRELFQQVSTIQRALSSLDQIENLFRKKIEAEPILDKPLTKLEKITFKNVSFRYPDTSEYVLKNISFNLHSKQKLALVGATGSGKSSILRVLSKQYEDYEGSIKINGIELKEIPRKTLLDFASIQFQDTLFI